MEIVYRLCPALRKRNVFALTGVIGTQCAKIGILEHCKNSLNIENQAKRKNRSIT